MMCLFFTKWHTVRNYLAASTKSLRMKDYVGIKKLFNSQILVPVHQYNRLYFPVGH